MNRIRARMPSVTLVHPAKAVGRHEMPRSRTGRADLGVETPVRSHVACRQITLAVVNSSSTLNRRRLPCQNPATNGNLVV